MIAILLGSLVVIAWFLFCGVMLERSIARRRGRKFDDQMRRALSRRMHPSVQR